MATANTNNEESIEWSALFSAVDSEFSLIDNIGNNNIVIADMLSKMISDLVEGAESFSKAQLNNFTEI